jgi:CBS domain containing-hemolysin-like protein
VFRDRIDNVVGILHLKDLFVRVSSDPSKVPDLESLLRKPAFVPATQLASSVLTEMRAGRHHMAIVIDEYGGMAGVLTLEDLLEEIVGDIQDEHDDEEPAIVTLPNGHIVVDASVPIAELNRHVGFSLPDDGDYNSLGGFIVEVMGRVPEPGAVLERVGHRFLVKNADERHVTKVEISPQAEPPSELQASA